MSHSDPHSPDHLPQGEAVFIGTSQWRLYFPLVFGVAVCAWLALELGFRSWLPDFLGVDPQDTRIAAGALGGVNAFAALAIAWVWFGRLRWVGVSESGLRWKARGRVHSRPWGEFAGIKRKCLDMYGRGKWQKVEYGAELAFHTGRSLVLSPNNIQDFDALLAAVEAESRGRAGLGGGSSFTGSTCDRMLPGWSKYAAAAEEGEAFGPLRIRPDGVRTGKKTFWTWDQIKSYEVSHGYLLITAENGTEFLRRLPELGDWQVAVERLDAVIGAKRVGTEAAAK